MDKDKIISELKKELNHEDYHSDYFSKLGIKNLFVGKGTLGPEMSWVAQHLTELLARNSSLYKGKRVLDIGAGTGIQGLATAINGAKYVLFSDISDYAIRSIKKNMRIFQLQNADFVKSDLFENIPESSFDLIIFNHPFFNQIPKNKIEGIFFSGEGLLGRFFSQVRNYLKDDSILIMPFSHFAGAENNPEVFAGKFGFKIISEVEFNDSLGRHSIYLITR